VDEPTSRQEQGGNSVCHALSEIPHFREKCAAPTIFVSAAPAGMKALCQLVGGRGKRREVFLNAVYSDDKASSSYSFSQYTPQASFQMVITNPAALEQFEPGKTYDLVFTKLDESPKA
jgi:hypothetical protein